MSTFNFTFPADHEEAKQLYRALCMLHHPDRGGDVEAMQALTEAWRDYTENGPQVDDDGPDFAQSFIDAIRAAAHEGVIVELCGAWLWASGATREIKDALKAAGWKWSHKKVMWYYHEEKNRVFRKHSTPIEEIRAKYGSSRVGAPSFAALRYSHA